jgi:hypothetical protein
MINRLMFRPNLVDCILEERVAPAIANLATVILTTTGLTLIEGFPGANSSGAGSVGSNSGASSASSVSGVAMPTSFYVTGTSGISSLKPGNITGVPSLGAGATTAGGVSISIQLGSGADAAGGPTNNVSNGGATNNVVGRATVADPTANPTSTVIGGMSSSDAASSPVLPPGQSYRDSAPVPAASSLNTVPNSATAGPGMSTDPYAPNPQAGAPTLGPFNMMNRSGGMVNPIPGSLVPVSPLMPGNN